MKSENQNPAQESSKSSGADHTGFTATYSAEDNKLRLYSVHRLDAETYAQAKALDFRWAPKQELFVAPSWSPKREDFCIELAGEIEAEQSTMAERAEAKAARLDKLAAKRSGEISAYQNAANRIAERFADGQPILIGHHSERRARKDQDKIHAAMAQAKKAHEAANYWAYKATGVECHANYKNRDDVRVRRIKTLLAELRDLQRATNFAQKCVKIWEWVSKIADGDKKAEATKHYAGLTHAYQGSVGYREAWSDLDSGKATVDEVIERALDDHQSVIDSPIRYRWIAHTLNRLQYERGELGETLRYNHEITPVILQAFARENGADKPEAKKSCKGFELKSGIPLPLHIADSDSLDLSCDEWRDLMQSVGYQVPVPKLRSKTAKAAAPLLNFKAVGIKAKNRWDSSVEIFPQKEMTKAEYAKVYADYKGTVLSLCGQFKFRACLSYNQRCAVFLTDSKAHPVPESVAIDGEVEA